MSRMRQPLASRFVLTIQLGNDAMRTWADVARALREVARTVDEPDSEASIVVYEQEAIHDVNGNRVGGWHTDEGK